MVEQTQTPKGKRRNWMRIALIISVALNLLIVGAISSAFWRHDGPKGRHLDRATMGLGAYVLALPEPAQNEVMALIGKGKKDRRAMREAMREHRQMIDAAVQKVPFSAETVRAQMAIQRGFVVERITAVQDEFIAAMVAMDDQERAAYFERVQQIKQKHGKKWRKSKQD